MTRRSKARSAQARTGSPRLAQAQPPAPASPSEPARHGPHTQRERVCTNCTSAQWGLATCATMPARQPWYTLTPYPTGAADASRHGRLPGFCVRAEIGARRPTGGFCGLFRGRFCVVSTLAARDSGISRRTRRKASGRYAGSHITAPMRWLQAAESAACCGAPPTDGGKLGERQRRHPDRTGHGAGVVLGTLPRRGRAPDGRTAQAWPHPTVQPVSGAGVRHADGR
jgi:hypothetical protein